MGEQRRHQRARFTAPPAIALAQTGVSGNGSLINLSLSGMLIQTALPLTLGEVMGCRLSLTGHAHLDFSATVITRIGDLFGIRFKPGAITRALLSDGLNHALACGDASKFSLREVQGQMTIEITGGLRKNLENDFEHALRHYRIHVIDLQQVTYADRAGLNLCNMSVERYGTKILLPTKAKIPGLSDHTFNTLIAHAS